MKAKLAAVSACGLALLASFAAVAISTATEELNAALRLKPRLNHGAEIFDTCAACHGDNGRGAPDGSIPAIAGQPEAVIVKQIVDFRYDARFSIRMQHFVDHHHLVAAQDLADVAGYVSRLPPRQVSLASEGPDSELAQSLFASMCAGCHGPRGEGNASARAPRLAGQHAQYLTEQLQDAAQGRRPSMEPDHARVLARLSSDEILALSRYLEGLRG